MNVEAAGEDLAVLEAKLKFSFANRELLITALTHSSWAHEHEGVEHNERLEFLGDAVLEIIISRGLFLRFPEEREGTLTRMRSRLVSEQKLSELAHGLELGKYLRLGKGEESQGGRERPALLADAMEALFGAVFVDGGYAKASRLIARLYKEQWPGTISPGKSKDYKTSLQEITQAIYHLLPVYKALSSKGPEHAKEFKVLLELPDGVTYIGKAGSLKRAEQDAASQALSVLAGKKN